MVQFPTEKRFTVNPATVHTVGVNEDRITTRPEEAVGERVNPWFNATEEGPVRVIVCTEDVMEKDIVAVVDAQLISPA